MSISMAWRHSQSSWECSLKIKWLWHFSPFFKARLLFSSGLTRLDIANNNIVITPLNPIHLREYIISVVVKSKLCVYATGAKMFALQPYDKLRMICLQLLQNFVILVYSACLILNSFSVPCPCKYLSAVGVIHLI